MSFQVFKGSFDILISPSSDPLFQRTLVNVVRAYPFRGPNSHHYKDATPEHRTGDPKHSWSGLPVVFDEVFTGLYRLGRFSAASFLDVHPDITCHAKLLTGGLLPLSATIASDSIFNAFWGDEKADALLHGHSYTAHPIGCHVANTSLKMMFTLQNGAVCQTYKHRWAVEEASKGENPKLGVEESQFTPVRCSEDWPWSMWSRDRLGDLSNHPRVDSAFALGTVLAVTLKDSSGSGKMFRLSRILFPMLTVGLGYTSQAAVGVRDLLLTGLTNNGIRIHSPLIICEPFINTCTCNFWVFILPIG